MDPRSPASAALLLPAAARWAVGWRAPRKGRTSFGLGLRGGALGEFGRGAVFSAVPRPPGCAVRRHAPLPNARVLGERRRAGVRLYFLVPFLAEEAVFRSALMTGPGVLFGRGGSAAD